MLWYSKSTLRQRALFLRHNGAVHNTSESPVLLGRTSRVCSPGSPGSGVHSHIHQPWEPPSSFKKFNVLLSLSFWRHGSWNGKYILRRHIFLGMAMLLELIQGLRKIKKPDPFFENWQVLNVENSCADLLNFDDVLERCVLVIFTIVILLTSFA